LSSALVRPPENGKPSFTFAGCNEMRITGWTNETEGKGLEEMKGC
jgi:hypothetical protein